MLRFLLDLYRQLRIEFKRKDIKFIVEKLLDIPRRS
jgi:hypothetical protein